ncbi:MAG: hypothetical protein PHN95_00815 [Candidatus Pacebacteria bacterium]|nr:hypothetical protein [Candidatus Paceibacterota bacterium]MDD4998873.1 hypothetical protein [Candidatus Paceibacterota bacterium]MDD5545107.1 hypothetical protein [Candidatus Paceibacterota bacterium]
MNHFFKLKKYYLALIILILSALGISGLFFYFNPQIRQARQYKKDLEVLEKKIQEEEEKYKGDTYGAKTPEETYQMFLEALKKQDIDSASKYFVLEKQAEYKKLLQAIKDDGKWDEMMADLLRPENQKGKYQGKEIYTLEIVSSQNVSVASITLMLLKSPFGVEKKPLSDLWKITEF